MKRGFWLHLWINIDRFEMFILLAGAEANEHAISYNVILVLPVDWAICIHCTAVNKYIFKTIAIGYLQKIANVGLQFCLGSWICLT